MTKEDDFMRLKKYFVPTLMIGMVLALTGCGEQFPSLTEEEYDQTVEYAVGLLMKYSRNEQAKLTYVDFNSAKKKREADALKLAEAEMAKAQPEEEQIQNEYDDSSQDMSGADSSAESGSSGSSSETVDVDLVRSLSSASYNSFCVPFNMNAEQVEKAFGADAKLGKLDNARIKENDELYLGFAFVDALEAGVPYIIQPGSNVTSSLIHDVTISNALVPTVIDGVITFHGVVNPTEISAQSAEDHTILLLGAENTLSWPNTTANIKGMRAYL